jgi:hypothetical protein
MVGRANRATHDDEPGQWRPQFTHTITQRQPHAHHDTHKCCRHAAHRRFLHCRRQRPPSAREWQRPGARGAVWKFEKFSLHFAQKASGCSYLGCGPDVFVTFFHFSMLASVAVCVDFFSKTDCSLDGPIALTLNTQNFGRAANQFNCKFLSPHSFLTEVRPNCLVFHSRTVALDALRSPPTPFHSLSMRARVCGIFFLRHSLAAKSLLISRGPSEDAGGLVVRCLMPEDRWCRENFRIFLTQRIYFEWTKLFFGLFVYFGCVCVRAFGWEVFSVSAFGRGR